MSLKIKKEISFLRRIQQKNYLKDWLTLYNITKPKKKKAWVLVSVEDDLLKKKNIIKLLVALREVMLKVMGHGRKIKWAILRKNICASQEDESQYISFNSVMVESKRSKETKGNEKSLQKTKERKKERKKEKKERKERKKERKERKEKKRKEKKRKEKKRKEKKR
ncbi:hypothetical protein H8356DRAFT_1430202 [Neocallimastix lanati (nom. inval.)]|nr:hypothetical protein H8356DRAFT_1430202 [Neocallimastix sp. JGI-2020a]